MNDTVTVLVVMPAAQQRGGAELTLSHLGRHARSTAVDWHVVFLERGPMKDEMEAFGASSEVIEAGRLRNVAAYVSTVRGLIDSIRATSADLVLSWMSKGHLYSAPAAQLTGRPALWFQHAMPADVNLINRMATILPADRILTCSTAGAEAQQALWPHRRTQVVHPGVELDRFDSSRLPRPSTMKDRLGLPDGPIVGIVGRLQHWKGIHVFIRAMKQVRERFPNARGLIVGGEHPHEPAYPEQLDSLITQLDLRDHVIRTGFQENVHEWMQAMDVVVHASDREPFGLVVVEAMALGKPVVASDTAGPTEVISAGDNGLFAPFGDDRNLARQIMRYLSDPEFARRIGAAASERARHFSAKRFAERIEDVVREVCLPESETSAPVHMSSIDA